MTQLQQVETVTNPHKWAYSRILFRKPVNIVRYDRMVRVWNEQQTSALIEQFCKVSGVIAVSSRLLSRSQHEKNRERRIKTGKHVYYVFPCEGIPLDIYCRIKPEDGKNFYH